MLKRKREMGRKILTGHTPQNCNFCYFFYEFYQQAVAWTQKTVYNEIRLGIMSTMLSKGGKREPFDGDSRLDIWKMRKYA